MWAKDLADMLLLTTAIQISGQQSVASRHGTVDMIDQLFTIDSTGPLKQIAATADDSHNICQLVTQICRPQRV
jgi:hypothetical protein